MATAKCKKQVREDLSGVDFAFTDGQVLAVNVDDLSDEMKLNLILHGISQKVGDSYAGAEDCEAAHKKAEDLIKRLLANDWKTVRAAGGSKTTMLCEALEMATGRAHDECVALLSEMDDDQKAALQQNDQVAAQMAVIRARRAAEKAEKLAAKAADAPALEL